MDRNVSLITFSFIVCACLVVVGYLDFEIWGQIVNYRSIYLSNGGLVLSSHILRYLVIHPVYEISSIFGFSENIVYSWWILFAAAWTSRLWLSTRRHYFLRQPRFSLVYTLPFVLLFFINGRFIFGLLGLSLLLWVVVRLERDRFKSFHLLVVVLGFLFASVSSGIFLVGLLFFVFSLLDIWKRRSVLLGLSTKVIFGVPVFFVGYFSFVFLQKNIVYFLTDDGGLLSIFSHGLGFLLFPSVEQLSCDLESNGFQCAVLDFFPGEARVILFVSILLFFWLAFFVARKINVIPSVALRGLVFSVVGGVFGFTTFFSFIFVTPLVFVSHAKFVQRRAE